MEYYVYILCNRKNGTLYIGVTNNLARRILQHREGVFEGFTKKYAVKRLVYFETFQDIYLALGREKSLKNWKRAWKIDLIEKENRDWNDLRNQLL